MPTAVPVIGGLTCLLLLARTEPDVIVRAGVLLAIGVGLCLVNRVFHRPGEGETAPAATPTTTAS